MSQHTPKRGRQPSSPDSSARKIEKLLIIDMNDVDSEGENFYDLSYHTVPKGKPLRIPIPNRRQLPGITQIHTMSDEESKNIPDLGKDAPEWAKLIMSTMCTKFDGLKTSLEFTQEEVAKIGKESASQKARIEKLETEAIINKNKHKMAEHKVALLEEKLNKLENYSRRDNLIFAGVNEENVWDLEPEVESKRKVIEICNDIMGLNVQPENLITAHRLGKRAIPPTEADKKKINENLPNQPSHKKSGRPIIVRFGSRTIRDTVWRQRFKLGETDIHLKEDLTKETQEKRKFLEPSLRMAKTLGKKAIFVEDRLIVEGTSYNSTQLDELPEELKPQNIATQEDGDTIIFFTEESPFSNHHKVNFTINRVTYNCVEQFLMSKKAENAGDQEKGERIMSTAEAKTQKAIGKQIRIDRKLWNRIAPDIAMTALTAKFEQNPLLKDQLIATKGKFIGEAAPKDKFWGIGIGLYSKDRFQREKWGENRLGELLMKLRENIA